MRTLFVMVKKFFNLRSKYELGNFLRWKTYFFGANKWLRPAYPKKTMQEGWKEYCPKMNKDFWKLRMFIRKNGFQTLCWRNCKKELQNFEIIFDEDFIKYHHVICVNRAEIPLIGIFSRNFKIRDAFQESYFCYSSIIYCYSL